MRVEIATLGWGLILDKHGNGRQGVTVKLRNLDTTDATVYSAASGGTTLTTTGDLTTGAKGSLPGFMEVETYLLTVDGVTYQVEAVSGRTAGAATPLDDSVTLAKLNAAVKPTGTAAPGDLAVRKLGTGASDAAAGNDARLSDQRVPTDGSVTAAKVNGSLKPSGSAAAGDEALRALGSGGTQAAAGNDARFPTAGQKNALAGTNGTPGTGNEYVTKSDASVTNQRTPTDGSVTWTKVNGALVAGGVNTLVADPGGAAGDMLVRVGSAFAVLPKGSTGQQIVVRSDGTIKWTDVPSVSPRTFGAVGGATRVTDASINVGTNPNALNSTSAAFVTTDAGKSVIVNGAGAAGAPLLTTIASVSGGVATLTAAASTSVSNAEVFYGTDDYLAFKAAYESGKLVAVTDGKYLTMDSPSAGRTDLPIRYVGTGRERVEIYFPSTVHWARAAGSTATAINLSANAAVGDDALTITSTSTLAAGDYLLLKSEADWDATYSPGVKKGEVVRIASVDSSTTLTLDGPLVDSYATADTARVEKISYLSGHVFKGITMRNGTPEAALSGGTFVHLSICADIEIEGNTFRRGVGTNVLLSRCRDAWIDSNRFVDGAIGASASAGYGVGVDQWATDIHITNNHATRGHGGVCTAGAGSGNFGVSRYVTVDGNEASYFYNQPFHTHEQAQFWKFTNNRARNGNKAGAQTSFTDVFGIYCRDSEVKNNTVENCFGSAFTIQGAAMRTLVQGNVVRKQRSSTTHRGNGIVVNADSVTLIDNHVDGVIDSAASDDAGGHGISVSSTGTNCTIIGGRIANVDGSGIASADTTDSMVADATVIQTTARYGIYANGFTPRGKWRNIRTINTGLGASNQSRGFQTITPQREGVLAPGWGGDMPFNPQTFTPAAGELDMVRVVPPRDIKIASIAYWLQVNAGSNDVVDVAILDYNLQRVATSGGSVAGKLNTGASGWVPVSLTANYIIRQGLTYYLAILTQSAFGGTAPQWRGINHASPLAEIFGTSNGSRDMLGKSGQGGVGTAVIPADVNALSPASVGVVPFLKAVEA